MDTVNFLTLLVEQHHLIAYFFILLGLIFEGEVILIITGILSHLGALNIYFSFGFIVVGALAKTFLGYYIGKSIHNRWHDTRFLKYIEKRVLYIMPRFKEKPFWSIFISKFIFGLNNMVIIFSGYQRIEYKKYLKAELISTAIWAPLLFGLGYFFSFTALRITKEIWKFSLIILVLMIVFFLFDKLVEWLYEIFEEFYNDIK